jgi:hypothetical protein
VSVFANTFEPWGAGRRTGMGGLLPSTLKARMVAYKRNVAKRYRICTPDRIKDLIPEGNLFISTKVDGELWYLCKLQGEVALCSPTGRVIQGIPLVQEAEKQLAACGDIMVAGELFALVKGQRTRVKDVARALGDASMAPMLGFKVFDLVSEGEEDTLRTAYADRFARLNALFTEGRRVAVVATVEGQVDAVHQKYDEWVASKSFEGLVVRSETGGVFKVKPTIEVDAVILGFGEHRSATGGEVRELIIGLLRDDGTWHVLGTVGSGLTQADRLGWLRRLEPMVVPSMFRMANSEGTLCRWVRPEIVIELRVADLMDTDSRDAPLRRMVLSFGDNGWKPEGPAEFVSPLFPVFVRERTDKPVDGNHVGTEQVTAYLPMEENVVEATSTAPTSQVVTRRVWTKGGKGGVAVRKALALQTNKGGDWPPFVAHFTDYSAGRKEPLQTAIRVASTREALDTLVNVWMTENIKKGWDEVK